MPKVLTPESLNVVSCEYSPETFTLDVVFKRGGKYQYRGLPLVEMIHALDSVMEEGGSVGSFIARHIARNPAVECDKVEVTGEDS